MLSRADKLFSLIHKSHVSIKFQVWIEIQVSIKFQVVSKFHVWLEIPVSSRFQVWIEIQVSIKFQVVSNIKGWIELQVRSNKIEQIDGSQIQVAPLSICHILSQPSQFSRFQSSHCSYWDMIPSQIKYWVLVSCANVQPPTVVSKVIKTLIAKNQTADQNKYFLWCLCRCLAAFIVWWW